MCFHIQCNLCHWKLLLAASQRSVMNGLFDSVQILIFFTLKVMNGMCLKTSRLKGATERESDFSVSRSSIHLKAIHLCLTAVSMALLSVCHHNEMAVLRVLMTESHKRRAKWRGKQF